MQTMHWKNQGFTLIEMLVVIAVIAMLMSIMMPALQKAREQTRQVVCAANLHSIGQGLVIYAHDHRDLLVPGNYSVPWIVWGQMAGDVMGYQEVNLGYLMYFRSLPEPRSKESVFFCPSMNIQTPDGKYFDYDTFQKSWQQTGDAAPIGYMYNTALDGFGNTVLSGRWPALSHKNRIQYLMPDGSVQTFKDVPLVYDAAAGPELLQDVAFRTGVNFPALLLHQWLAKGLVELDQAKAYLADPVGWMNTCASSATEEVTMPVRLAQVTQTSLVSDVVGVWDTAPPRPG